MAGTGGMHASASALLIPMDESGSENTAASTIVSVAVQLDTAEVRRGDGAKRRRREWSLLLIIRVVHDLYRVTAFDVVRWTM